MLILKKKEINVVDVKTGKESVKKYDTLVIATGASPKLPPVKGIDSKTSLLSEQLMIPL